MQMIQVALLTLANGFNVLLAGMLWLHARKETTGKIAIALFISSVGYSFIVFHETHSLPAWALQLAVIFNAPSLGLGWLFGRALLEDRFAMGRLEWVALIVTTAILIIADADVFGIFAPAPAFWVNLAFVTTLAVMAHVSWIAIAGFRDDLLDSRRKIRIWFVVFVLLSYVLLIAMEIIGIKPLWRGITYDLTAVAIVVAVLYWAGNLDVAKLFSQPRDRSKAAARKLNSESKFAAAREKLVALLEENQVFRQPGLTIGALAKQMEIPEHQLRALINSEMGYRNYAEFINGYRLGATREQLSDRKLASRPILSIALDNGFRSLSTFNRAFKARYNETPTDYRERKFQHVKE